MKEHLGRISVCYTVTFERRCRHSPGRLWSAITDPDEITCWMGYPARVDLRPGGEWYVDFSSTNDGRLDGVIVRVEPERVLTYAWGWSVVEWSLTPIDGGCAYTFVQNGLADRGDDEEGLPAGWHDFIDRMEEHLEGYYPTREQHRARWEGLKPAYRAQLDRTLPGRSVAG
jgi:uncharacterized protein YndB with AHSA1/START domain